jgi:hypothetical protein
MANTHQVTFETQNHGREIFWTILMTKAQAIGLLKTMEIEATVPKKGMMEVIAFPGDVVGYLTWTKAVSESGERFYRYELERNIQASTRQAKARALTIVLSSENDNEEIRTLENLQGFILNELENADIGALLKIVEVPGHA